MLIASLATGPAFGADTTNNRAPRATSALAPLALEPVYRVKAVDGKQRFVTRSEPGFAGLQLEGVAFLAVCTNEWPPGLVGIFAVEKTNRIELRRRPARGQENSSDPLFFAVPPEDEPDASKLAGHWEVQAIRGSGTKEYLAWELASESEKVSGRFDQNTQYRFAYVTGGTFRSNQLELRVEYVNEGYLLRGQWLRGEIKGEWHRADDSERGTWEASRESDPTPGEQRDRPAL